MAGIFMLGDVLSAIKPPKLSQVKYSDALGKQLDNTTNSLTGYRANQAADLSKYGQALDEATGKVKALEAGDNSVLAQLIASSNQDPMDTYRGVGDYQFGVLDKLSKSIAGQGRAQDNALLAQFGAGGRGGSTYQTNSILDRLTRNLAPVYAGALSNLGKDTNTIVNGRTTNAGNVVNLLNTRAGIPLRTLPLQTATMDQRTQNLMDEIAAEGGLGNNYRTNSAGFKEEKNKVAGAFQAIDSGLNSAVDTAMSLYSGGLGGGGGGGIMSFLGGGGGGNRASTPNAGTFIQQGNIGGGSSNQQILQLIQQLLSQGRN